MARNQDRTTIAPSTAFDPPTGLTVFDAADLRPRESYDGISVDGGDRSGDDLTAVIFTESELSGMVLTDTQLRGARFVDTAVAMSFAPSLLAARSSWRRCRVTSPRWGSAELFDSVFDGVSVVGGKIDYLNLRTAKLTNVIFENCTITELDIAGATLDRVAFVDCRIDILEAANARCTSVDLRTSEFSRINGLGGLRGATIDDLQLSQFASALAQHIGLRVE